MMIKNLHKLRIAGYNMTARCIIYSYHRVIKKTTSLGCARTLSKRFRFGPLSVQQRSSFSSFSLYIEVQTSGPVPVRPQRHVNLG